MFVNVIRVLCLQNRRQLSLVLSKNYYSHFIAFILEFIYLMVLVSLLSNGICSTQCSKVPLMIVTFSTWSFNRAIPRMQKKSFPTHQKNEIKVIIIHSSTSLFPFPLHSTLDSFNWYILITYISFPHLFTVEPHFHSQPTLCPFCPLRPVYDANIFSDVWDFTGEKLTYQWLHS